MNFTFVALHHLGDPFGGKFNQGVPIGRIRESRSQNAEIAALLGS